MKYTLRAVSAFILIFAVLAPCFPAAAQVKNSTAPEFLTCPDEAISVFEKDLLCVPTNDPSHPANKGRSSTGLFVSPYWNLKVNGETAPVYASLVFDYALGSGVLQSFEYIFVNSENFPLEISADFLCGKVENAVILPQKRNACVQVTQSGISTQINGTGDYTVLINNDSQEYALTLFIRENTDENAEITAYENEYGKENVAVYEKGVYQLETLPADKEVIYFKRGAFVSALHTRETDSTQDESPALPPFFSDNNTQTKVVDGCGIVDFTRLDLHERTLINFNFCSSLNVSGLILLDPCSWSVTAYACENSAFEDITVFGYRVNSDGINICGCNNIEVKNCFCRNGDDCFSAKATNTYYECHDIEFSGCTGWSCKARCFGITGEVERNIYNIAFRDCSVIYRNAVWDNDRVSSLAVSVETGKGCVDNVLFENIEIHRDTGRVFNCIILDPDIENCKITNIQLKNITAESAEKMQINADRNEKFFASLARRISTALKHSKLGKTKLFSFITGLFDRCYASSDYMEVSFENVTVNAEKFNLKKHCLVKGNTQISYR